MHITTCTRCQALYEETSEEEANSPTRECFTCFNARKLTAGEITVLTHTLTGGKRDGKVYRNHFYTGPGSDDMPIIEQLVTKGFMIPGAAPWGDGGDRYYHCTAAGAAAVGLELPKDRKEQACAS